MSHRDALPEDFVGKTIKSVDVRCINIWKFTFTDNTKVAIEVESFREAGPGLILCDECVSDGDSESA